MDTVKGFGKRLIFIRKSRKETQQQLADAIGITRQSLSLYETNQRTPNIDIAYKIAKHYDISSDYLLGLSDNYNKIKKIPLHKAKVNKIKKHLVL